MGIRKSVFTKVYKQYHKQILFAENSTIVFTVISTVVFPLLELTLNKIPLPGQIITTLFYIIVPLHLIFSIITIILNADRKKILSLVNLPDFEKTIFDLEGKNIEKLKEIEIWKQLFSDNIEMLLANYGSITMLNNIIHNPKIAKKMSEALNLLMLPYTSRRVELFKYGARSIYNFAIYLYDKKSKLLKLEWRCHHEKIVPENRPWKPNQGFAGNAFSLQETQFSGNADDYIKKTGRGGFQKPSDTLYYQSFISSPILNLSGIVIKQGASPKSKRPPYGVITITSSTEEQFSEEHKSMVETIAGILSIFLFLQK
jgi:hypothetical protein